MGPSQTQTQGPDTRQEFLKSLRSILWELKHHSLWYSFTPGSWWGGKSANPGIHAQHVEIHEVVWVRWGHVHGQGLQGKITRATQVRGEVCV